jgi:PmbA protein
MERVEILKLKNKESVLTASGNKLDLIRSRNITKSGVRLFDDSGIRLSNYVGEISDVELIEMASKNENIRLPLNYKYPKVKTQKFKALHNFNQEEVFECFNKYFNLLKNKYSHFVFNGDCHLQELQRILHLNDETLSVVYDSAKISFGYTHKETGNIIDGYFSHHFKNEKDFETALERYFLNLNVFENVVELNPRKIPVIFQNSTQLISKFLEAARVDKYSNQLGLFKERLGEKILSEKLTLYDQMWDPEEYAFTGFSAEGEVRSELMLLNKGVFSHLISNLHNQNKFQVSSTGNSSRQYNTNSNLGYHNVRVKKGSRSIHDIVKDLDECILVEMAGGGEHTDTGFYSTPVQGGFYYKNGKLVGKIPQITLSSHINDFLGRDLIDISCDSFYGGGHLGHIVTQMKMSLN